MPVDDELEIRCHGIETARRLDAAAGKTRQIGRDIDLIHRRDFGRRNVARDIVRRYFAAILLACDLHAASWSIDGGKAIDALARLLKLPDEDREPLRQERVDIIFGVEPELNLPIDLEIVRTLFAERSGQPRPGGDNQSVGGISRAIRGDGRGAARRVE